MTGKGDDELPVWIRFKCKPVFEVLVLIPLKCGLHMVKIKTTRQETFKLWYLSI